MNVFAMKNRFFTEENLDDKIVLKTVCPFCGKHQQLVLTGDKAQAYQKGKVAYMSGYAIQAAFPSFNADEREFLLTGICAKCWENF